MRRAYCNLVIGASDARCTRGYPASVILQALSCERYPARVVLRELSCGWESDMRARHDQALAYLRRPKYRRRLLKHSAVIVLQMYNPLPMRIYRRAEPQWSRLVAVGQAVLEAPATGLSVPQKSSVSIEMAAHAEDHEAQQGVDDEFERADWMSFAPRSPCSGKQGEELERKDNGLGRHGPTRPCSVRGLSPTSPPPSLDGPLWAQSLRAQGCSPARKSLSQECSQAWKGCAQPRCRTTSTSCWKCNSAGSMARSA